ncbi:MAG: Ig-like domain-containing protein [Myxococcota bacterium]|nr:Ig-like domain-containing protein [Myxococcota bacterium]
MNIPRLSFLLTATTLLACSSPRVVQPVLAIVNISPSGGSTGVALDAVVSATFTQPLRANSINEGSVYLLDEAEEKVAADLTYVPDSQAVLLDPTEPLSLASNYVLVLGEAVASSEGNNLLAEIRSTFRTTGDAPTNELPIANAGTDTTVSVTDTVTLDGSESMDPEGSTLDWSWSFQFVPDGSVATLEGADTANPTFLADLEGTYTVALVVSDGIDNSNPAYVQIEAVEGPVDTGEPTDTGDTGDTSEPPNYDGFYTGPVVFDISERQVLWAEDSCTGTIELTVDSTAFPPVAGTWACTFTTDGPFYNFWPTLSGTLDGTFTETNAIAGNFVMEGETTAWGATFATAQSMAGSVPENQVDVDVGGVVLDILYSGDFTATR